MYNITNKFNLVLSWQQDNISVYSNEFICLQHTKNNDGSSVVKMDYRETFIQWAVVPYCKLFKDMEDGSMNALSKDIEAMLALRHKAIIEYVNDDYSKEYKLDFDCLEQVCL